MGRIELKKISTRAPEDWDKKETKEKTALLMAEMIELQNLLYAENKHCILIVLQGMDASGKDGVIRNVLGGMNPQGVSVNSFKAPSTLELSHDFLWRVHQVAPQRGMIKVFNRSHYEDILITRVHKWCDDETARKRMKAINHFEELLQEHNSTHILKFYLHISAEEQAKRLQERLEDPTKMWKYNAKDSEESKHMDRYTQMYEECFEACNKPEWHIVPSDQNWYKEHIIASELHKLMKSLDMKFPTLEKEKKEVK